MNVQRREHLSRMAGLLAAAAAVSYPVALHLLPHPIVLIMILCVLASALLLRVLLSAATRPTKALALGGAVVLLVVGLQLGIVRLLRWQPVLLNGALLIAFATSLWRGMPLIERIARVRRMPVGDHNLGYLRALTGIWAGFFAIVTAISLFTLAGDPAIWLWWNGGLMYVAIFALVGGERAYREVYRRRLVREGVLPDSSD